MSKTFNGWYYKCQSDTQTLAAITASHGDARSIQIITDAGAWNFTQDIDNCRFTDRGMTLDINEGGTTIKGEVSFGEFQPLAYDIMGPFHYVPFMQCVHSVRSMKHSVNGSVTINGIEYAFKNASGYLEGDRGRSFPKEYLWTHTFFDEGSLMLSVAHIPFGPVQFTGIICAVHYMGREYRIATYHGAKVERLGDNSVTVTQGRYRLTATLLKRNALPLAAPVSGQMVRTIHESASCVAGYRLEEDGKILFEFETNKASFEYEYDK